MLKQRFSLHLFLAVVLTLGLTVSGQSLLAAWQEPAATPPGDNAPAPVNVSVDSQYKRGPAGINLGQLPAESLEVGDNSGGVARLRISDLGDNPELQLKYGSGANDHWGLYAAGGSELRLWRGGNLLSIDSAGNVSVQGEVEMNGNRLRGLPEPTSGDDAATKEYVDDRARPSLDCFRKRGHICDTGCPGGYEMTGAVDYDDTCDDNGYVWCCRIVH